MLRPKLDWSFIHGNEKQVVQDVSKVGKKVLPVIVFDPGNTDGSMLRKSKNWARSQIARRCAQELFPGFFSMSEAFNRHKRRWSWKPFPNGPGMV
jgi:hypothetical protein